jgi:hypothetical protein
MVPDFPKTMTPAGADRSAHMRPELVENKLGLGPIGKKKVFSFYYNIFFQKNQTDRQLTKLKNFVIIYM